MKRMLEVITCKCGADFAACVDGHQDDEWNKEKREYLLNGCSVSFKETISWGAKQCTCKNELSLLELEKERFEWSLNVFPSASAISSLEKLKGEIHEVEKELYTKEGEGLLEEYVDCLMCLFDSIGRAGFPLDELTEAYHNKLVKNKARTWVKNPDNTYSHIKSEGTVNG